MISNWLGQRILHGSHQFSEKLIKCPTTVRKREKGDFVLCRGSHSTQGGPKRMIH